MSLRLDGRTVLVTGASRGIGLGIARALAASGATLHLLADDPAVLTEAQTLGAAGHVADVTVTTEVAAALAGIEHLDGLVNNAGLERITPLDDASDDNEATFRRVLEINVTGIFLVTRAALPLLGPGGRIVNTASTWGRIPEPLFGAYVASKHAVIGLTKTWAKELGPRGICVNAIAPGWVRTDASLRTLAALSDRRGASEEALLGVVLAGQALPGLMQPDDVAGAYVFLLSDLAANITGQTIGVDRGEAPWG